MVVALKARLVALGHFIVPKKRLGIVSFIILTVILITVYFVGINSAQAVSFLDDPGGWILEAFATILFGIASLFIRLAIFILSFIIEIAGYNGFIDARAVNYGWVMVRDLANMFFVVVLLLIAFGTILGIEQYEWKKMLVKLVFAAILVNFSRIICALIIDVAQVIMITFVNAIAATAGGNFINAFGLEKVLQISRDQGAQLTPGEVFIASVAAVGFSVAAMAVMAVFLVILLGRMVTLWVAIIFSPLAFVLNVIPQTQKYASQWWSEFNNNVIVGPVVVFFLWLSFVTVGSGDIHAEIYDHSSSPASTKIPKTEDGTTGADATGGQSAGLSRAMNWNQMANFAIALGILLVGAKVAGQLGATGASGLQKAANLGVKAAALAGGVVAARWAYKEGVKPALKFTRKKVLMNMPFGGKFWKRQGGKVASTYKETTARWRGKRNRTASDRLKIANDTTGNYSTWQKIKARAAMAAFAPKQFKEKQLEDRKENAKLQEEIAQYDISTTNSPVGKKKLRLREEARLSKLRADKKVADYATTEEEASSYRAKEAGRLIEADADLQQYKNDLRNAGTQEQRQEAQQNINKRTEQLHKEIKGAVTPDGKWKIGQSDIQNYLKAKTAREASAHSQNVQEDLDIAKQEKEWESRGNLYKSQGDLSRAENAFRKAKSIRIEKMKESVKGRTGNELVAMAGAMADKVLTARAAGDTETEKKKLQELYLAVTMARGHEEKWVSRATDALLLDKLRLAGVDVENMSDQEAYLSIDLLKDSRTAGVAASADEIENNLGNLKDAALRERFNVDEGGVVSGISERAEVVNHEIDPDSGSTRYMLRRTPVQRVIDPVTGATAPTTTGAATKMAAGYLKTLSLSAMVEAPVSVRNRNGSGKIQRFIPEELATFANKAKQITTRVGIDKINDRVIDDFNTAVVNFAADPASRAGFQNYIDGLGSDMEHEAYEALKIRLKPLLTKFIAAGGNVR